MRRFFKYSFVCAALWYNLALLLTRKPKHRSAMFSLIITFALAAFAIWLLVDSAVEFVRDGQDEPLATEP